MTPPSFGMTRRAAREQPRTVQEALTAAADAGVAYEVCHSIMSTLLRRKMACAASNVPSSAIGVRRLSYWADDCTYGLTTVYELKTNTAFAVAAVLPSTSHRMAKNSLRRFATTLARSAASPMAPRGAMAASCQPSTPPNESSGACTIPGSMTHAKFLWHEGGWRAPVAWWWWRLFLW